MRTAERLFKALGDRNRIRILKMLEARPMCVCEITCILGIAQPSVSRHLSILREAGLVTDQRDGIWVEYALAKGEGELAAAVLAALREWGSDDPVIASDREKTARVKREKICAAR